MHRLIGSAAMMGAMSCAPVPNLDGREGRTAAGGDLFGEAADGVGAMESESDSTGVEDAEDSGIGSESGGEDSDISDETETEEETEPVEALLPLTGEYDYAFSLQDDPCGWRDVMDTFNDGIADVMPTEFDVVRRDDGFDIEAIRFGGDFGTEGPVRCDVEGTSFSCEPQSVCPVDMFLCSYGWQYVVTFSGDVVGERQIEGTSEVRYASVDGTTAAEIARVGLDASDCTQTFDMLLQLGR